MADDIRNHDTIEVLSPLQRQRRLRRCLRLAFVAGVGSLGALILVSAIVVGASPSLRRRIAESRPGRRLLAVETTPKGADVFVDEAHVGAAPVRTTVSPGSHTVRIVQQGYKAWQEPVDARTDQSLDVMLEPVELARLIVESTPEGAQVFIDRENRGATPLTLLHIAPGTYQVEIRKPRHLPVTREIEIAPEETHRLAVQLKSDEERHYLEAIAREPDKLGHYIELLHIYTLKHNVEKALAMQDTALAVLAKSTATATELRQLADELTKALDGQLGPVDDARKARLVAALLDLLENTILADPSESAQYLPLVAQLGKHGQFMKIKALCNKLAKDPKVGTSAHTEIAIMFLGWGETSCALMLLQRAVALDPESFTARRYLASTYYRAGKLDEALAQYAEAEKLAPKQTAYHQALVHTGVARILAAREDVDGALARYEKALALKVSPTYSSPWRFLYAQLLVQNGRRADAIEQYQLIEATATRSRTRALARAARMRLATPKPGAAPKRPAAKKAS